MDEPPELPVDEPLDLPLDEPLELPELPLDLPLELPPPRQCGDEAQGADLDLTRSVSQ